MKNFLQVNRALRAKKNFNFNFKSLLVLSAVLLLGSTQVWGETVSCSSASATSTGVAGKITSTNYTVYFTRGSGGWGINSGYGYQGKTDAIAVFELLAPTNVDVIVSNIDSKARSVEVTAKPFTTVAIGEEFLSILEVSYTKPAKFADCVSSSKNYAEVATTSVFYNTNHSVMCTPSNTQLSTSTSYSTGEQTIANNTTGVEYSLGILPAGVYAVWFSAAGNSNVTLAGFEFSPANPTFSVSADAELTAETDDVTLTSAGNTIYYKWSTNSSAYAANAGSTLAGAADGSGTSPVDATAPAGTGTYYLYAVAKNGTYYSDVVKRSYTIVAPASDDNWYLHGTFEDGETWDDTWIANGEDNEGYVDITLAENTTYKFDIKHVQGASTYWSYNGGEYTRYHNNEKWSFNGSGDCKVRTDIGGTYRFSFVYESSTPKITITYPTGVAVTLDYNHNSLSEPWQAISGQPMPTPPTPSWDGYAFDGWYTTSAGTTPFDFETPITSATTIYAKWSHAWYYAEEDDKWVNHVMTRSDGESYWYRAASKKAATRQFKIQNNGTWYDCRQSNPGYNCTDWTDMNRSNNNYGLTDYRAGVYNNTSDYYIIVFPPYSPGNTSGSPVICASTTLPEDYYSVPSGRTIYFDNSSVEWSNVYFRKGRDKCTHNEATAMSKVTGTDNLYELTTDAAYDGYQAFQIANNTSWTGSENSIYLVNGSGYAITGSTEFQKYAIDKDMTFTPGDEGDLTDGCQYYETTHTSGMKKDNVSITAPTNGTITVAYTSGGGGSITSGDVDLAHTSILTISATGATGYDLSALTVNETAHTSGENYILSEDAVVAATFTPQVYSINYKDQGNVTVTGEAMPETPYTHTYGTATTLKKRSKAGYVFGGWYTNSTCTEGPVTSLGAMDVTSNVTLYAKWTAMNMTALENNVLYKAPEMVPGGLTITGTRYQPGVSTNEKFNILGVGTSSTDNGPMGSGVPSSEKNIADASFNTFLTFRKPASGTKGEDLGSTLPDNHAVQFQISDAGKLDIYCTFADSIYLVKDGGSAEVLGGNSPTYQKISKDVVEGTYYLYGTCISADPRLYGLRFRQNYTITLNDNGGNGDGSSSVTVTYNSATIASITPPTKDGYVFGGWYSGSGGTGSLVIDANGDLQASVEGYTGEGGIWTKTAATTLYANWVSKAVYNPDMSTSDDLTTILAAKFGGNNRWTLTTGENLVGKPSDVGKPASDNLAEGNMAYKASSSAYATYDLGAETTIYQLTLKLLLGDTDGSVYIGYDDGSWDEVASEDAVWEDEESAWIEKTFDFNYPTGVSGVRYIHVFGNSTYQMGMSQFKVVYAPTKTEIVLDNQRATTAGTESVTATYGASTNLTSSITAPIKAGYVFGGYYTEEAGAGTQLIDANGAWLASKTDYTDGSKNWQFANPDLTLYAKWTQVYASGSYSFDGNLTVGTSPSKTVSADETSYSAFRVDNIFFSDTKIQFEGTDGTPSGDGNDYNGWKVKANTTIKFFVENNSDVVVSIGSIGDGGSCSISYTNQSNVAQNDVAISAGSYLTYKAKAGTMVTVSMSPGAKKSVTLKRIAISDTPACTNVAAVSSLSCSTQTGTTLTFTWTKAENAEGYTATLYSDSGCESEVTSEDIDDGNTETVTFTSLSANTTYYCKVQSHGDGSTYCTDGSTTNAANGTTLAQYDVTITVNPSGYGSVTESSLDDVDAGTEISTSSNSLTIGETTITASPAATTAQYTYAFTGWTDNESAALPDALAGDLVVYANFSQTPNSYSLTWNTNGGSDLAGNPTSGTVAYGTTLTKPTDPTRSGYDFGGWFTNNDGTGTEAGSTMPAANTTYYAKWTQTVTLDANTDNGGDEDGSATATINGTALSSVSHATGVTGYKLTGYFTAATGGTKVLNANGTFADDDVDGYITDGKWTKSGATTLYAQWEERCVERSLSKVVLTSASAGTVTGYNFGEYAGDAVIGGLSGTKTADVDDSKGGNETGYKLNTGGSAIVFATLKKGTFQEGDQVKVTITYQNDNYSFPSPVSAKTGMDIYYGTNASDATLLTTLSGVDAAGTYSYTLTSSDISAIGSKVGIGVLRHTDRPQNQYVYSVEIVGCREYKTEYTVIYDGNGEDSGEEPVDTKTYEYKDQVTVLGNTGNLTKTGYTFRGWTDGTTFYRAGDKLTMKADDVTLKAVWESNSGTETITLSWFDASQKSNSSSKPDSQGKWLYGYNNSAKTSGYAYTITTANTSNKGQGTGDSDYLRQYYGTSYCIYADNTGTEGTPNTFSGVTAIALNVKYNKNAPTMTIKVGETTIADAVSLSEASTFTNFSYSNLSNLSGKITITNNGSGSTNYDTYIDDIAITYAINVDVTYDNMDGFAGTATMPGDIVGVPVGSKINRPADPTTEGDYVFGGWYKEAACSNAWDFASDKVTCNTTLYAKWIASDYKITWMVGDDEEPYAETKALDGVSLTSIPTPPADNTIGECANSFRGWSETNLYGEATSTQPADLFIDAAGAPIISANKTFYAVFGTATTVAYAGTVLWSEDWTGTSNNDKPIGPTESGSVVYRNPTIEYRWECGKDSEGTDGTQSRVSTGTGGATGGSTPDALIGSKTGAGGTGGYLLVDGIPVGCAKTVTVQYVKNGNSVDVSYYLDGVYSNHNSVTSATSGSFDIDCSGKSILKLKFEATTTSNVRLDNIVVKVKEDGATNYRCICPSLTVTPKLVTASTPIFITSAAEKTVRSQDSLLIVGSGLDKSATLTLKSPSSKFALKTRTNEAISTDETGAIDAVAYIFYTPDAGDTSDGLDKYSTFTVTDGSNDAIVDQALIGRHLPADFVIVAKNGDKWYALPADMSSESNPTPVEIAVDDKDNPTVAYSANTNIYNLYGQNSGAGYLEEAGQYIKLGMKNNGNYPLYGYSGAKTTIKGNSGATVTNNIGADHWWLLTQTNTSANVSNPKDARYTIANASNEKTLSAWFTAAGGPKWGLYAAGNGEHTLRILPVQSGVGFAEAEIVAWGKNSAIVEVDNSTMVAEYAIAKLPEDIESSAVTLSQTRTSVKGTGTRYNYTLNFGEGVDFSANEGKMLTLEWYDALDNFKAVSNILVPCIVAENITINKANYGTKSDWNKEVHVLPGDTVTIDASAYVSSNVTIKELVIYPGAKVVVEKGTLIVPTLVLRNGWNRLTAETEYNIAQLYIMPITGNLQATNAYADWYIDYDQYYPIAVPWKVATANISYRNMTVDIDQGLMIRYYNGERRAGVSVGGESNWTQYTWGVDMPANLEPGIGYAITARRPAGKAFSIIRMPLTIPSTAWTTAGEQGNVEVEEVTTHKDEVTVTAWAKNDGSTPDHAKGWNFVANPYMASYEGEIAFTPTVTPEEDYEDEIAYVSIPDVNFKEFEQVAAATAELKPGCGFLIQTEYDGKITFATGSRKADAPYRTTTPKASKQKAYILLSGDEAVDQMGLIIADRYTENYELNADLEKLLSDGNTLRTYMQYNDLNMAYVAINSVLAQEWIPVSVRVPATGEYTYSIHRASRVDELEGLYLIDYETSEVTNLLENDYVFTAEAGTITDRFAINAIYGPRDTPTDIDVVSGGGDIQADHPIKFLYQDKIYIYYRGVIYDAAGKKVAERRAAL